MRRYLNFRLYRLRLGNSLFYRQPPLDFHEAPIHSAQAILKAGEAGAQRLFEKLAPPGWGMRRSGRVDGSDGKQPFPEVGDVDGREPGLCR